MAGAALALFVFATADAGAASAAAPPASAVSCADDTVRWGGAHHLAVDGSFATGVDVVPPAAGETVSVVGVSADGLDANGRASALPVEIGGVVARAGAPTAGGAVVVRSNVSTPVTVSGVTVVVRRCAEVASASSASSASTASTASTAGGPVVTAAPSRAEAAVPSVLPETGRDELTATVVGGLLVALGAALVVAGRREVTVGARVPGSPRAVRPPSRG